MLSKKMERCLSFLMAVIMVLSLMPVSALAAEEETHDHTQETVEPAANETQESAAAETTVPAEEPSPIAEDITEDENSGISPLADTYVFYPLSEDVTLDTDNRITVSIADADRAVGKNGQIGAFVKTLGDGSGGVTDPKTATITITNNTASTLEISYNWTALYVSNLTVDGDTLTTEVNGTTTGTTTKMMAAGASIVVKLTSSDQAVVESSYRLSGFTAVVPTGAQVTVEDASGEATFDGAPVTNGVVNVPEAGGTLATDATNFVAWINADTGAVLSKEASFTLNAASDMTVKALRNPSAIFAIGTDKLFDDLNKANAVATSGTIIVLTNNGTLPKGNYTIKDGVTLLIPYNSSNTMFKSKDDNDNAFSTSYTKPTAFRTLTMASGANITVASGGAISLSAQHHAGGAASNAGSPTGPVSFIKMSANSNITVQNGGFLYAWGFITGSGTVTVKSGGSVYENFQINDFRGGTHTTWAVTMSNKKVFPLNSYFVQNVEVAMTLESGANEYATCTIKGSFGTPTTTVKFVGSGGMFNISSGYAVKKYDGSEDRLIFDIYGNMELSSISLNVGGTSVNSKDFTLPLNSNITINIHSGKSQVKQSIAMLPGTEVTIDSGAELAVAGGYSVYVYDSAQWNKTYCYKQEYLFKPVAYAPGRASSLGGGVSSLADAKICVNGTLNATEGALYTTAGGANICSTGNGVVKITKRGTSDTYQYTTLATQKYLVVWTGSKVDTLTSDSARLLNGDGKTYVSTAGDGKTSTTYEYYNGKWCAHSSTTTVAGKAATCTATGLTEGKNCSNCGKVVTAQETIAKKEHSYTGTYRVVEGGHERLCVNGCNAYGGFAAHSYTAAVTNPTCTAAGYTTHTCACGDNYTDTPTAATGHSMTKTEAVAPTCHSEGNNAYYTCGSCKGVFKDEAGNTATTVAAEKLEKTAHTPAAAVQENIKNATCGTAGSYDSVVYCSVEACKAEISRTPTVIPATGNHTFGTTASDSVRSAATCTAAAQHWVKCDNCTAVSTETSVAVGNPLGHTDADNDGNHTCDRDGCGAANVTDHAYSDATCTAPATCSECGATNGSALGHDYAVSFSWNNGETVSAMANVTCGRCDYAATEAATVTNTAEFAGNCGAKATKTYKAEYTIGEKIYKAEGHVVEGEKNPNVHTGTPEWTKTSEKHKQAYTCCGAVVVEEAIHTWDDGKCSVCEYVCAHSWTEWDSTTNAPTCEANGFKERECQLCDKVETEILTAPGHTKSQVPAVPATCENPGTEAFWTCSVCHENYSDEAMTQKIENLETWKKTANQGLIPALGHDMQLRDEAVAPKCGVDGKTAVYTCTRNCGHTTGGEKVDALQHNWNVADPVWSEDNKSVSVSRTCTTEGGCQATETATSTSVKAEVTTQPTYNAMGQTTYTAVFNETWASAQKTLTDVAMREGEARVGDTNYGTLAEAVKNVGENKTITVLKNVKVTDTVTIPNGVTLDFNGFTVEGTVLGTLKINNGLLVTAQGYNMIGNGATYYSATDDVVLTMVDVAGSITIHSGTVNMLTDNWSLPGQTLTVGEKAQFVVPTGVQLNVNGATVVINGKASISGTVNLYSANATITVGDNATIDNPDKIITTAGNKVLYKNSVYSVHSHDLVQTAANAATCLATGNNEYWTCSDTDCGEVFKADKTTPTTVEAETIPALGHKMTHTPAKAATCTEDGTNGYYTCGICNKVFKDADGETETTVNAEVIGKLNHMWKDVAYTWEQVEDEWTCTASRSCGRTGCGASETATAEVTSAEKEAATCTEMGWTTYTASFNVTWAETQTQDKQDIAVIAHTYTVEAVNENTLKSVATCTEKAVYYYSCKCGAIGTETFEHGEKLPHSYLSSVTKEAGCTEDGVETYKCKNCTDSYTKAIPQIGHSYNSEVTAPTCENQGYTTHTCANCSDSYVDSYVNATGHSWGEVSYSWNGSVSCTATRTCNTNSTHVETETVNATQVVTQAATCTTVGYCKYVADFQSSWAVDKEKGTFGDIPALNHDLVHEEAKPATCTVDGWNAYDYCQRENCDYTTKVTITAPGHTNADAVKEKITPATCEADGSYDSVVYCATCGAQISRTPMVETQKGHSYTNYVYNNDATANADGTETAVCDNDCGTTDTRTAEGTMLAAVAKIGDFKYADLNDAIQAAQKGQTIVLVADANAIPTVEIAEEITIDLGGKNIGWLAGDPARALKAIAANGFNVVDNSDGTYSFVRAAVVETNEASIGSEKFATLDAAIQKANGVANGGAFINLRANVAAMPNTKITKPVTIITNGYTLWGQENTLEALKAIVGEGYTVTGNDYGIYFVNKTPETPVYVAEVNGVKYTTVKEALENAQPGDTVTMIADSDESQNDLIMISGVKLNTQSFDLSARSFVGFNGSEIYGTTYVTTGAGDCSKLTIKNLILGETGRPNGTYTIIPVYIPNGGYYVFANFRFNTTYQGQGLTIDKTQKRIYLQFNQSISTALNNDMLKSQYSAAGNKFRIVVRITWQGKDGVYELDYAYTDQFVINTLMSSNVDYTCVINNYNLIGLTGYAEDSITVQALLVTESGLIVSSGVLKSK